MTLRLCSRPQFGLSRADVALSRTSYPVTCQVANIKSSSCSLKTRSGLLTSLLDQQIVDQMNEVTTGNIQGIRIWERKLWARIQTTDHFWFNKPTRIFPFGKSLHLWPPTWWVSENPRQVHLSVEAASRNTDHCETGKANRRDSFIKPVHHLNFSVFCLWR